MFKGYIADLILLQFALWTFTDTGFFIFYFNKSWFVATLRQASFPGASVHFVPVCQVLVIPAVVHTFS